MISLPIQKVMESFTAIERLKENGWREAAKNTANTKKTAKSAVPKKKPLVHLKTTPSLTTNTTKKRASDFW